MISAFVTVHTCNRRLNSLPQTLIIRLLIRLFANNIDPDERAHNEPSHLDLRCLTDSLSTLRETVFQAIAC